MTKKQFFITIALLVLITTLHYSIPQNYLALHIIFRMLYLIPIIYIGLQKGIIGGIATSISATLLFLPHFFFSHATTEFHAGNIVAVILFNVAGIASGILRSSSEKKYQDHKQKAYIKPVTGKAKNILFYAENSPATIFTAKWFTDSFLSNKEMIINIIWISHEDKEDVFESSEKANQHVSETIKTMESLLEEVQELFITAGLPAENIRTKKITVKEKVRTSDKICEEINSSSYDVILLSKYKMTKSQEFLLGDTAIHVLRNSGIPVLSVIHGETNTQDSGKGHV